MISAKVMESPD